MSNLLATLASTFPMRQPNAINAMALVVIAQPTKRQSFGRKTIVSKKSMLRARAARGGGENRLP